MKKWILDHLPTIWVVAIYTFGMVLVYDHAKADWIMKKPITYKEESKVNSAPVSDVYINEISKKVEDKLSWGKSRSEWIQEAIERKLDPNQSSTLREASLLQLLSVLTTRDITEHLRRLVQAEIEIIQAMLVAETEEAQ